MRRVTLIARFLLVLVAGASTRLEAQVRKGNRSPVPPYQAPGTGAVARTIGSKLADIVSVKDFGAAGNGTTDDTAAIQTAISAAYGATLLFPPGTYKLTAALNIASTNGITLRGKGATLATNQQVVFNFNGASSNVTFEGLKLSSSEVSASGFSGLITGIVAVPLINIKVIDCDFTAPTSATNGIKFDVSNVSSSLVGLEVSGSRFASLGRMAIEIVNHTFDNVSRYESVRITGNRMDSNGLTATFGQAVSFSGMGRGNVAADNTITNAANIGIEVVGPWTTVIANNTLRNLAAGTIGISHGKPASAAAKPQGNVFAGNAIDGNGGFGLQLTGMQDAVVRGNVVTGSGKVSIETSDYVAVSGNTFDITNQVLFVTDTHVSSSGNAYLNRTAFNPEVTSTTLSRFVGDEFLSEKSPGLLVDGTSADNTFIGCTLSNEGSGAAGNPLQFSGASVTRNAVVAPTFRRTAAGGGALFDQINSATGNVLVYFGSTNVNLTFTMLTTMGNGSLVYCSDCTVANPCAGGGTGAFAKRLNGIWVCN